MNPVLVQQDEFKGEVIRFIEPMNTCSDSARLTFSYRTRPGVQEPPDTVRLTISSAGAFWSDQVAASPRLVVLLNGKKFDGGPISFDNTSVAASSPYYGLLVAQHVTVATADLSREAVEKLAQAQTITLHFLNTDVVLSSANIESIQGFVATWAPGYQDPLPWTPPRRF